MKPTRVVIADHHMLVQDGIRAMLDDQQQIEVAATASGGKELLDCLGDEEIDLVILDINMPGMAASETVRSIRKRHPEIKILGISGETEPDITRNLIGAGMHGHIRKSSGMGDLLEAIQLLLKGKSYFDAETTRKAGGGSQDKPHVESSRSRDSSSKAGRSNTGKAADTKKSVLTERELEVLMLICQEFTNKEIAEQLYISVRTVDAHRRNLLQKTGARNTAGLVSFAYSQKLVSD